MARILINSIVLYLVAFIYDVNGKLSNKLVGGHNIHITSQPFQVSVRIYDNHHLCGGSIITPLHILTSASCVTSDVNIIYGNLKVLSGTSDGNNFNNFGTLSDVALVMIHHGYSPRDFWANDISILKLTESLYFSHTRGQINSPEALLTQAFSLQMIGFKSSNGRVSRMPVLSIKRFHCKKIFGAYGFMTLGQSCIKPTKETDEIHEGDGGNPVLSISSGSFIGIVSLITVSPNDPTVITELFGYYDKWMKPITEKF
ncbi:hypothetical protein HCN44_002144 [Aphidius gifuensis]|uniref:Peptidase S1 domain-containing protein n=1 Tax=Aphidius gifuensis TaxID=684658 RepID=A0A835CUJ7_APHGI|nr:hypothetical protein HCN44_002144 [Aphidius gifuensis]